MGGVIEPPVVHLTPINGSVGVGSNQSTTFTATIGNGQLATITFYYDGALQPNPTYGSSASFSTPAGDSAIAGNHVVRAVASNANGSSEAFAYWHIVPSVPSGEYFDFEVLKFKCHNEEYPDNEWREADCHYNAFLRIYWADNESFDDLPGCEWKTREFSDAQSFMPPEAYGKKLYYVSVVGKYIDGSEYAHAVTAYLKDGGSYDNFSDYRFMQWTNNDIQIGVQDTYGTTIQIPPGYTDPSTGEVTDITVEIKELTNIRVDYEGNRIYTRPIDFTPIETFIIDQYGEIR